MNPELPDLEPLNPTQDMAAQQNDLFTTLLFGFGVLVPLVLVFLSFTTGQHLWLTLLNMVGMYLGLAVLVRGWRRDRRRLVYLGAASTLVSFIACLGILSLLR